MRICALKKKYFFYYSILLHFFNLKRYISKYVFTDSKGATIIQTLPTTPRNVPTGLKNTTVNVNGPTVTEKRSTIPGNISSSHEAAPISGKLPTTSDKSPSDTLPTASENSPTARTHTTHRKKSKIYWNKINKKAKQGTLSNPTSSHENVMQNYSTNGTEKQNFTDDSLCLNEICKHLGICDLESMRSREDNRESNCSCVDRMKGKCGMVLARKKGELQSSGE